MTGISESDMNRINEFIERNKFERSPELLCPSEEEGDEGDEPPVRHRAPSPAERS